MLDNCLVKYLIDKIELDPLIVRVATNLCLSWPKVALDSVRLSYLSKEYRVPNSGYHYRLN